MVPFFGPGEGDELVSGGLEGQLPRSAAQDIQLMARSLWGFEEEAVCDPAALTVTQSQLHMLGLLHDPPQLTCADEER